MNDTFAPLAGTNVIVFAGLGPVPFAAMMLADFGANVTIIDRPVPGPSSMPAASDPRRRGQRSIVIDLRTTAGSSVARNLIVRSDVVVEGLRPGAMERLGFGPDECTAIRPDLVYVRITGWGQTGPLANTAGHDINYLALSGVLGEMGPLGCAPQVPLNLLGDYAAGGVYAALGVVLALLGRMHGGGGSVIDAAIVDGIGSLATATLGMRAIGSWGARGTNAFDGSRPWYTTYATRDGKFVAVGAIEEPFFAELMTRLGLDPTAWPRDDHTEVERLRAKLTNVFASRDRDHWETVFAGSDACVTPVLSLDEAIDHPHHRARGSFSGEPAHEMSIPAPRWKTGPALPQSPPAIPGADTDTILDELGYGDAEKASLRQEGVVQ